MSSPWQTIRQAKQLVATATWADSPADVVVGASTYITPEITSETQLPGRVPFALLNLGSGREDADDPLLVEQEIYLILATAVGGHDMGEFGLIGGSGRVTGESRGRGLLEIQKPILQNLANLYGADGTVAKITPGSAGGAQWRDGAHLAYRQYIITVLCSIEDEYPAPSELATSGNTLSWHLPPARFDLSKIHLRYASGATAPASVTAGTGITLASDLATSHDVSAIGAGTYSFALFAEYNDVNANDLHYSPQDTGSYRASVSVS